MGEGALSSSPHTRSQVKECNKRAAMHEVSGARCFPAIYAFATLLWQRLSAVCYLTCRCASTPQHGHHHGGLSPALLADVAADEGLRQKAMDALDTHVCGELPIEYHALKVAQEVLKVAARRDAAFEIPKPLRKEEYLARGGPKAVVAHRTFLAVFGSNVLRGET